MGSFHDGQTGGDSGMWPHQLQSPYPPSGGGVRGGLHGGGLAPTTPSRAGPTSRRAQQQQGAGGLPWDEMAQRPVGLCQVLVYARCACAFAWVTALVMLILPLCLETGWGGGAAHREVWLAWLLVAIQVVVQPNRAFSPFIKRVRTLLHPDVSRLPQIVLTNALPVVALWLSPRRWFLLGFAACYCVFASSLLLWPYRESIFPIPRKIFFVCTSLGTNAVGLLLLTWVHKGICAQNPQGGMCQLLEYPVIACRPDDPTGGDCVRTEFGVVALVCVAASVLQGLAREAKQPFVVPSVKMTRRRRVTLQAPALLRHALVGSVGATCSVIAAIVLIGVCGKSVGRDNGDQLNMLVDGVMDVRVLPKLVALCIMVSTLLVFLGATSDAVLHVWLTEGVSFQDDRKKGLDAKMTPLIHAALLCNPAPTVTLPSNDAVSRFHFMRVHLFNELDSVARFSKMRCARIFESDWAWDGILRKHLDTLRELSLALRDISEQSTAISAAQAARGERGLVQALGKTVEMLGPRPLSELGLGMLVEDGVALCRLERSLSLLLQSTDMHCACVASLSSLMTESQRTYRDVTALFRPDRRGVCVRAVGPVLCHLLDLSVRLEQLCASDAYVAPQIKLGLRSNQMMRPAVARFAAALELATYSIVTSYYLAIRDVMGQASSECADWISWSERPQKDWKELYLPRLQSYMAFKTSVLPAGEPPAPTRTQAL